MGFELLGLGFAVSKTIENGNGVYIFIWYTGISNNWDWDFEKKFGWEMGSSPPPPPPLPSGPSDEKLLRNSVSESKKAAKVYSEE